MTKSDFILEKTEYAIIHFISKNQPCTITGTARGTGFNYSHVWKVINRLSVFIAQQKKGRVQLCTLTPLGISYARTMDMQLHVWKKHNEENKE